MKYPRPLDPHVKQTDLQLENYSRAGNSYVFGDDKLVILKSGNRYSIDFSKIGEETIIETNSPRNQDLDNYVLDAEYYGLLNEGVSLSHFSTFSDGEKAYILTGPPNTGKTGINLALNQRGFKFMADENAPVTKEGQATPLRMPLSIGNNNIEEFRRLLEDLGMDYSKTKAIGFKQARKLPLPLVDKALDRLVEPIQIDPEKLDFEEKNREIDTAYYIQPENRSDIKEYPMSKAEFYHKMAIWNKLQRNGFEKIYRIWKTENNQANQDIENSAEKDKQILEKCFEDVEIKKLKVPLERQPREIAEHIEEKL